MNAPITKPALVIALSLGLSACDSAEPDWANPGATAPIAAQAVPSLVEVAAVPPAPAPEPAVAVQPSKGPKVTVVEPPEVDRHAKLAAKRIVVAQGVKDREPVGEGAVFSSRDERIYAFVEVGNPSRSEAEIFVSFVREGGAEGGRIPLRVGPSPRWRTWAFTRRIDEPGRWHAIVRDGLGREIGRAGFEVRHESEASSSGGAKAVGEPAT
jgi:hypothetical protein